MDLHNNQNSVLGCCDGAAKKFSDQNKGHLSETVYACWLDRIPTIGPVCIKHLLAEYQSAEQLYRLPESEISGLAQSRLLTAAQAEKLREYQTDSRYEPWQLYEDMTARGIHPVRYEDESYPNRLRAIPDPPRILYVKGGIPDEAGPSVGIVGARLCSDYGRYTARKFSYTLAKAGVQIISGMALGIDGISHKAAIEAGGRTFAVLGCGADVCYPEENRDIYEQIQTQGGVISEYPPGTSPHAGLFPRRNRIISGLTDLLLVIEARKKSGTLITVDAALEQGREVYALPGRGTDALSGGCNRLIAQGAGIATSPEELLEELRELRRYGADCGSETKGTAKVMRATENARTAGVVRPGETSKVQAEPEHGTEAERLIYALLSEDGQTVDMLMSRSVLSPGIFSESLMHLCISGRAVLRQGRYYRGGMEA